MRMFLTGVAGFVASSVRCSAAVSAQMLIASRVAQGAFAAVMIPQGLGLIRAMYPPDQMAKAFAVFGPVMGISATAGPVLGGALVDGNLLGLGWRAVFLLNVPVGLLAMVGAARLLPADVRRGSQAGTPRLDLIGLILATGAALLLVYPLVQGREAGWPGWTFAMMAASAPAFGIFALHQRARRRAGRDPLTETSIWRKLEFCSDAAFVMLLFGSMTGMFFALTLFMQLGEHFTPLHAGLTTLPWSLGGMVSMGASQGMVSKVSPRRMIQAGVAVMAAGPLGTAWTTTTSASPRAPGTWPPRCSPPGSAWVWSSPRSSSRLIRGFMPLLPALAARVACGRHPGGTWAAARSRSGPAAWS